jgi:hypothetical protein
LAQSRGSAGTLSRIAFSLLKRPEFRGLSFRARWRGLVSRKGVFGPPAAQVRHGDIPLTWTNALATRPATWCTTQGVGESLLSKTANGLQDQWKRGTGPRAVSMISV